MMDKTKYLYLFGQDPDGFGERLLRVFGGESPDACPFFDASIKWKINEAPVLEFSVPIPNEANGIVSEDGRVIQEGQYVLAFDDMGKEHAFFVGEGEDYHTEDGQLYRHFICEHLAVKELNDEIAKDFNSQTGKFFYEMQFKNDDALTVLTHILKYSRWKVGKVNVTKKATFSLYENTVAEALKALIESVGCEYQFRIEHDGHQIVNRYIDLTDQLGMDNGVRLDFGTNIISEKRYVNANGIKTALIGRGKGEETGDGYGRRIGFEEIEWKKENGHPVDKPKGQEWVGITDPAILSQWGINNGDGTFSHRFGRVIFEGETDPSTLLQRTYDHLLTLIAPNITYEVKIIDLSNVPGYEHKRLSLGDVARIVDRSFTWDLTLATRVIERTVYIRRPEDTEVVLGTPTSDLSSLVRNIEDKQKNVLRPGDPINWLEGELDLAKRRIISSQTFLYIGDSQEYPGLYLPNAPAKEFGGSPTEAVYLTSGGILVSDSIKPDGTFNWRTAITGKGINADVINAGTLNADMVKIQTAQDDREIYLTEGVIRSYFQNRLTLNLGGYGLYIHDHGLFDPTPDYSETGAVALTYVQHSTDGPNERSGRGIGMFSWKDMVSVGFYNGIYSDREYYWEGVLYSNRTTRSTYLVGPATETKEDYTQLLLFADRRPEKEGGTFIDGPGIRVYRGNFPGTSTYVSGIQVYISDFEDKGQNGWFQVYLNQGLGSYSQLMHLDSNQTYFGPARLRINSATIDASGGLARWQQSASNYMIQGTDGTISFYMNGSVKHKFNADGSKIGGSVEINGKTWGMSPIDSPQMLIEDVIFDQPVTPKGKVVQLDWRFSQAVDGQYDVFPSRGDVEVEQKNADSFVVKGPKGKVSLRIIGVRKGTKQYFYDLSDDVDIVEKNVDKKENADYLMSVYEGMDAGKGDDPVARSKARTKGRTEAN